MTAKITMIIPTMNRPELVDFALRYHADFPGRIIIADGSDAPHRPSSMPKNVTYLYEPLFWQRRNRAAMEMVDTPYTIFRADRRCVTNLGIQAGIRFLEENPDYAAVDGTQVQIFPHPDDGYELQMAYPFDCLGEPDYSDDPAERMIQIFYPTYRHLSIWAVTRTEVWRDTVQGYDDLMPSANMYELFQIMVMAMHGKFAVLPIAFSAIFANYDHRSHYYNPVYPQHAWDAVMGEQDEVYCSSLTKTMVRITGKDEASCRSAIQNSLETFFRYTLKRPRIRTDVQRHLQHLDERSIAEFHELGRAYVSEIMGRKNLRVLCVPTWRRSSAKVFDALASRWSNAETYYLIAQDYSYNVTWHGPNGVTQYAGVRMLKHRYDGTHESKKAVIDELLGVLTELRPDMVCILSEFIPVYALLTQACRRLDIKVCIIQSDFPSLQQLAGDIFLGWDAEWCCRFALEDACVRRAAGSFDYERIVHGGELVRVPSETGPADETVIAVFLPDDQKEAHHLLKILERKLTLFPASCRFVIPCPPKGRDIPANLILARNNLTYLPQLVDEDFLFQRIDVLLAPPVYSAMRAAMAGILTLVLDDRGLWSELCPSGNVQVVAPVEAGGLLDALAEHIRQGRCCRLQAASEAYPSKNPAGLLFQENGAEERNFFREWREILYEQGILPDRSTP